MVTHNWFLLFLAATLLERWIELAVSKRNARWSLTNGGREYGQGHYPAMVALHSALFVGVIVEVWLLNRPFIPALGFSMLALALLCQALRWWVIRTLGRRWNTRVIVIPGLAPVAHGPFRFLRHPNYLAVVLEGIALPLIHTGFITAAVFTVLNAILLTVRIRCENRVLYQVRAAY